MSITQTPAHQLPADQPVGDWDYIDPNVGQPPIPKDAARLERTAYPFLEQQLLAERFLRKLPTAPYKDRDGTWRPVRTGIPQTNVITSDMHIAIVAGYIAAHPIPSERAIPPIHCPICNNQIDYPTEHSCFINMLHAAL